MKPLARYEDLVVQEIGEETIIYDERRHHAHCLNLTAGLIWSHCDGQRTIADLTLIVRNKTAAPVTEDMIWLALDRLEREHLLQEKLVRLENAVWITRREVLRKAALVGGLTLFIPIIQSMVAPTPAMAMSIGCAKLG
ncbi:MAG: PqqD family peptide modification chaperone [Janthinobacterium lividum]